MNSHSYDVLATTFGEESIRQLSHTSNLMTVLATPFGEESIRLIAVAISVMAVLAAPLGEELTRHNFDLITRPPRLSYSIV